jgi:antitoxin (DNA-binding transcriptional repressor) of toxin-antitoxin stability system
METIGAAKFKEQCLSILDHLSPDGLVITKRGKPVARLIPIPTMSADLIGSLKDEVEIHGDIMSTGVKWNAND